VIDSLPASIDAVGVGEDGGVTVDAPQRSGRTMRDMAISIAVLLVPLAIVVAIFRAQGGEDATVVDPGPAVEQAQAAKAFPVTVPKLDGDWRTVSAVYRPGTGGATLRLGYLTPDGGALQVIESSEATDVLLIRELGDQTRPTGVTGAWNTYDVRNGEAAWVRKEQGRTVIIIGRADRSEFDVLAAALP
jgi:hypothetical protein